MPAVKPGLDIFCESPPTSLKQQRIGLLCNPASVDSRYRHARERIRQAFPDQLKALYSPQHGFYAERQDNMIESADRLDPVTGLPVFSLYGNTRIPTRAMMDPIDVMLVDLQDVGTRVYTFIYTLSHCMEAAARYDKRVVILDRPNPLGGDRVEGNCLDSALHSFVGRYAIPMRHGLTIGEFGQLINQRFKVGCQLTVIPMTGWRRSMYFDETGLPWVCPSPNMPTLATALVYPGQVLWEGTNVSEGRGTTLPFELLGPPYLDPDTVQRDFESHQVSGVRLRPVGFEPLADKWQATLCRGFQLHVTQRRHYQPYRTSLILLQAIIKAHPHQFAWTPPPYEYDYVNRPIDLILGSKTLRQGIEAGIAVDALAESWQADVDDYREWRRPCLLYG